MLNGVTQALSPEVEADRFILAVKQLIKEGEYEKAENYLNRIQELEVDPPPDFYYAFGLVYKKRFEPFEARKFLEQYIEKVGSEGEFYTDALVAINSLEEDAAKPPPPPAKANIDWSKAAKFLKVESSYIKDFRDLYLTESSKEALELHLNSLLSVYHVGNGPNLKVNSRISYVTSININNDYIVASVHTQERGTKQTLISSSRFSVFGINPYVDYGCNSKGLRCWVSSPLDGSQWIRIIHDYDAAKEIVKALTSLIKEMQKG
jgi:tetratricopeptide (TPR) repeat protein